MIQSPFIRRVRRAFYSKMPLKQVALQRPSHEILSRFLLHFFELGGDSFDSEVGRHDYVYIMEEFEETKKVIEVSLKSKLPSLIPLVLDDLNTHNQLIIRSSGNAISKAIGLVEILKSQVSGLNQINSCYLLAGDAKSKEEVSGMDIIISKQALDITDPCYQYS
jgi:DNA-binding protein